jgi:2',3'-cyclic-nucleotide 2'-phosphodiesterase / 3'-nucleotidase
MTRLISRRLVVGGLAGGLAARPAAAAGRVRLRLMETSDLHMFARDFDYYKDRQDLTVGLSRVSWLVNAARKEQPNNLLFDNGDILQGNPLGDYLARPGGLQDGQVHPFFRMMNHIRYDAATVGNHEFNYGLPFLERSLKGAAFPFVCANVQRAGGGPFLPPSRILTRTVHADDGTTHTLRIGVIGFVTPQIMVWDKSKLEGRITAADVVESAEREVPKLRPHCDVLIALCHGGISVGPRVPGAENAAFYLAKVPGIDAIFTGHSHRVFPGPDYQGRDGVDADRGTLAGVPAVMPGYWGSHLGLIDLVLERVGATWRVADFTVATRPIYRREGQTVVSMGGVDASADTAIAPEHAATRAWMAQPIGRADRRISSYFALAGDDSVVNLINAAQIAYAKPLLAGTPHANLPLLSAAAPFRAGGLAPDNYIDIAPGPIALRQVADLYVYPNTLAAVRINGETIRIWLERAANIFLTLNPDDSQTQALLDKRLPSYNFDVISGLSWSIDLRQPPQYDMSGKITHPVSQRIVDLQWNGAPIDPAQEFIVDTNNYRADGGGGFPGLADHVVLRAPDTNRDAVAAYFRASATVTVHPASGWRFVPLGGIAATFECAPAGRSLLNDRSGIRWIESGSNGWDRFMLVI